MRRNCSPPRRSERHPHLVWWGGILYTRLYDNIDALIILRAAAFLVASFRLGSIADDEVVQELEEIGPARRRDQTEEIILDACADEEEILS